MKSILSLFVAISALTQLLPAQTIKTITFATSDTEQLQEISVPAGQVFKLLLWGQPSYPLGTFKVDGISVVPVTSNQPAGGITTVFSSNFVIAGPRTITIGAQQGGSLVCSYTLINNADVSAQSTSITSVVIPTDATGPVQIILESSTDLITWTAATPGTYGASTTKRFFRVRGVAQ